MNRVAAKMQLTIALDPRFPLNKTVLTITLTHVRRTDEPEYWWLHATVKDNNGDDETYERKEFGKFTDMNEAEKKFKAEIKSLASYF